MTIKLKVTRERFEEVVSVDDEMYFSELTKKELYEYMLQFVWGTYKEKSGETETEHEGYLPTVEARKLFKKVLVKDLDGYIIDFYKAINNAFVNPPNGAASEDQS